MQGEVGLSGEPKKQTSEADHVPGRRSGALSRLFLFRTIGAPAVFLRRVMDRRPIQALAALLVFSLIINALESFGLEERADTAAANAIGAIYSPLYGGWERQGQNAVTVVAVDTRAVEMSGGNFWPMPYEGQLSLTEAVLRHGPAAVFLDFFYM